MYCCYSNTTADVKQQLMFVGQESGKLLAVRDIIRKVYVDIMGIIWNIRSIVTGIADCMCNHHVLRYIIEKTTKYKTPRK